MLSGCKDKGKPAAGSGIEGAEAETAIRADGDDETLMPIHLISVDGNYKQLLYWMDVEEPERGSEEHRKWELQEKLRRDAAEYTNLMAPDGTVFKIKFVDELLKDPDGNTPSIGEIHGRKGIPTLGARYVFVHPDEVDGNYVESDIALTDGYLKSRKHLDVSVEPGPDGNYLPLPDDVVRKMEKTYGMKAVRSMRTATVGNRYVVGAIQFAGEYKDAPRVEYDRKVALALEVLVDGDKVYAYEELGQYGDDWCSWNVDDDGEYIPCYIDMAFEGPKGLELCYSHGAPESYEVGMFFLRDGKYVQNCFDIYQFMVDEEIPVWKSDIEQMRRLVDDANSQGITGDMLTQWAHFYLNYDNEWIWLRTSDEICGAFFFRSDGKFTYISTYAGYQTAYSLDANDTDYLIISGSLIKPTFATEAFGYRDGKLVEHFESMQDAGQLVNCELNGKTISKEEGQRYLDLFEDAEPLVAYFKDVEAKR